MGCVANITRVLTALPGVDSAVVNKDAANAVITFNPAQQSAATLSQAIEDAGFDVRG